jgi:hypothetical protein
MSAEKLATLKEIVKPDGMVIGNNCLYVNEKVTFHVYSFKDFKYLTSFGKEGEGPEEIKKNPFGGPIVFTPINGRVYVSSLAKFTIYDSMGKFIKEIRIPPNDSLMPLGDKYLASTTVSQKDGLPVLSACVMDKNLKKIKDLYISDITVGQGMKFEFPWTPFFPVAANNRIYIPLGKEGFVIGVFSDNGNLLYRIEKQYTPIKVSEDYKKNTMKAFKANPNFKQFWEFLKNQITFKKFYPPVQDMAVGKKRIYVFTYRQKQGKTECIVLDLKGKEIKRVYVPYPQMYAMDFRFPSIVFQQNFYLLSENEDEEVWELHRYSLK